MQDREIRGLSSLRDGPKGIGGLGRFHRLWHTLRHLKVRQLFVWLLRRGVQERLDRRAFTGAPPLAFTRPVRFSFLNHEVMFDAGEMDWRPIGVSRLWAYNLHYFGYLHDGQQGDEAGPALVRHWIRSNPPGSSPGWEPYALSLRLVNWCRWLLLNPSKASPEMVSSAALQANWLMRRQEKHILANHYFENLKALVFAGVALPDAAATRCLRSGEAGLRKQLREQFLPDGGHYERSPSYHCLLLEGLLQLVELDRLRPGVMDAGLMGTIRACASRGLSLLAVIEFPGDRYPLFNDSAFDSAPLPSRLYAQAGALGLAWERPPITGVIRLPDFGVYGWRDEHAGQLLVKCGAVGPAYQPGHTHCDLLSFEWYLDGEPVIVDTGVYEYEPGAMRQYVRSTVAHNTVAVGNAEQSEVWGEFRVARRARILRADIAASKTGVHFEGQIRAFPGLRRPIEHTRSVELSRTQRAATIRITDIVRGAEGQPVVSRLLFHPEIDLEPHYDVWLVMRRGKMLARLHLPAECAVDWQSAPYCPEFGVRRDARQLVLTWRGGGAMARFSVLLEPFSGGL